MKIQTQSFGRCTASPVFCRDIRRLEQMFSDNHQRFDSGLIVGSGRRCKFGFVQVIVCRPLSRGLRPFPTTFWLTCPHLIHRAGLIESQGGVRSLEEYMRSNGLVHAYRAYNIEHQVIRLRLMNRFVRTSHSRFFRSGIGGIRNMESVKCLHLQTASFLALRHHPAESWLRSKGLCGDCGGGERACRYPEGSR